MCTSYSHSSRSFPRSWVSYRSPTHFQKIPFLQSYLKFRIVLFNNFHNWQHLFSQLIFDIVLNFRLEFLFDVAQVHVYDTFLTFFFKNQNLNLRESYWWSSNCSPNDAPSPSIFAKDLDSSFVASGLFSHKIASYGNRFCDFSFLEVKFCLN